MNQILSTSHGSDRSRRVSRQALIDVGVGFAMVLVAVAITLALNLHFGLPMSRSVIAGTMFFALLIAGHFMIVPREPAEADMSVLEDAELWRTLKEQRSMAPGEDRIAMATRTSVASEPTSEAAAMESAEGHVPSRTPRITPDGSSAAESFDDEVKTITTGSNAAFTDRSRPNPEALGSGEENQGEGYWSYRPRDAALGDASSPNASLQTSPPPSDAAVPQTPVFQQDAHDGSPADLQHQAQNAGLTPDQAASPRESDVELVQSMIKKLAHQVNASETLERSAAPPHAEPPPIAPVNAPQQTAVRAAAEPSPSHSSTPSAPPEVPTQIDVDMVGESVEALRNTADALRMAEAARPDGAPNVDQPLRPAKHPEGDARGQAVTTPLATGQYGVMLEPILTLDGLQPQYYEVHLKLNTPAQAHLDAKTVEKDLQATNALSVVDQHRFAKAFSVGDLLHARGKATDVLTRVYRESLLNRDFCYAVASNGVANEALARHMVLSLTQDAIRSLTAAEWQTLSDFRDVGYRFAMCDITDIDMDFFQLSALGFEFVKLDAELFLKGGSHEIEATLSPQELARYFAGVGLEVILEGVDTAALAGKLAPTGAQLVQGQISGGPRLMRADVVRGATNAVA